MREFTSRPLLLLPLLPLLVATTALPLVVACQPTPLLPNGWDSTVYEPGPGASSGWPRGDVAASDTPGSSLSVDGDRLVVSARPLSLEDCVRLALVNNPNMDIADERVKLAGIEVDRAYGTAFLPRLQLGVDASYRSNSPTIKSNGATFAFSERWSLNGFARADFNIYSFGRTTVGLEYVRRAEELSRANRRVVEHQLIGEVIGRYFTLLTLDATIALLQDTIRTLQAQATDARTLFESGFVTENEPLLAELAVTEATRELREARNARRLAVSRLLTVIGETTAPGEGSRAIADLPLARMQVADVEAVLPMDRAVVLALQNRPDLRAMQIQTQVADSAIKIAEHQFLPSITAFLEYRLDADPNLGNHDWLTVGGAMRWEFLTGNKLSDVAAAKSMKRIRELEMSAAERDTATQVRESWLRVRDARQRVEVAEVRIGQAEANLRILRDQFRAGRSAGSDDGPGSLITSAEVLDGTARLARARRDHVASRYEELMAWSQLELATGARLAPFDWSDRDERSASSLDQQPE